MPADAAHTIENHRFIVASLHWPGAPSASARDTRALAHGALGKACAGGSAAKSRHNCGFGGWRRHGEMRDATFAPPVAWMRRCDASATPPVYDRRSSARKLTSGRALASKIVMVPFLKELDRSSIAWARGLLRVAV